MMTKPRRTLENRGRQDSSFWDTIDDYANYAEKALALGSLASMGATIAAPNPVTAGLAIGSNLGGAVVDGYQGIRSAIKGDYGNAIKNGGELILSIIGAKALSNASKLSKLDDALRVSGATRQYVTKTIGRRPATRHIYVTTKEADAATKASAVGYSTSAAGNASSIGDYPTRLKRKEGGKSTNYVTTGGAGYFPSLDIGDIKKTIKSSVRERAYNTISPYQDYSIMPKIKQFLSGKPRPDYKEEFVDTDEEGNTVHLTNEGYNQTKVGDELWAQYLQIPESKRRYGIRLKQSKYKPSQGGENKTYYKLPLSNNDIDGMLHQMSWLPFGTRKNMSSHVLGGYGLAEHTIGRGYDDKGDYISYFDKFDLNPFSDKWAGAVIPGLKDKEDASFGVGKPVNIYDRIYLDDYYGVKEPTHSMYLPEVVVTGRKKKRDGGGIHITPSKRGTFTAAATKHGMGVQEFASRVLRNKEDFSTAMVKKANFARNASKWKH